MHVTATSTWPWLDHRASDLILHTIALFRLGFPTPTPNGLSSHARLTRGPIIQKVRSHGTSPLLLFVCIRFQVFFTPHLGCFSPFLHSTSALSVNQEYLALEEGPPIFERDFTCPALLSDQNTEFRIQGYHLLLPRFPSRFAILYIGHWADPGSLATTTGISFDFFSCGY